MGTYKDRIEAACKHLTDEQKRRRKCDRTKKRNEQRRSMFAALAADIKENGRNPQQPTRREIYQLMRVDY